MAWAKTCRAGGYIMLAMGMLLVTAGSWATRLWTYVAVGGSLALVVGILAFYYLA